MTPIEIGASGIFILAVLGMLLKFLKGQKNGLPVVKEKVAVLERNTADQWKAIHETRDTVNNIDKKVDVLLDRSERD